MKVSIIIATMATKKRSSQLRNAIKTIRESSSNPVRIIVVVNGSKYDLDTCEWLKSQDDIIYEQLEQPSLPQAIKHGVSLVNTEFYGCLDDDDEFINMAIDRRLAAIEHNPEIDLVVSNGYRRVNNLDTSTYQELRSLTQEPLTKLMEFNWLASCNSLFRKSSIGNEFFSDTHPFAEWTWLAFKICMSGKNIAVIDDYTFRINDTEESLSKSDEYLNAYIPLFKKMLKMNPPCKEKILIQKKLSAAYHEAADHALKNGSLKLAFKMHILSLFQKGGLKYITFSRYFLLKR